MKIFLEIVLFELRQQLKSPFLLVGLILFFLIHFLSITSTGISLWAHPQANLNSAYAVAVVETTLTAFGMLPVMVFVANTVLRDQDSNMAELFLVKPIAKWQHLGGRFSAAWLLATLLGLAGLLGSLTGTLMPWLDSARVAAFSLQPFLFSFFTIVLPNMLILSALFFSVASLTHSLSATVALTMLFMTADFVLANLTLNTSNDPGVLALADHSATLVIDVASRNRTVAELNGLNPQTWLVENRLLWLTISLAVLLFTFRQFQFKLAEPKFISWFRWKKATFFMPVIPSPYQIDAEEQDSVFSPLRVAWEPLRSQLRLDLSSILRSPLFLIILGLGIFSAVSDYKILASPIMHTPLYPVTGSLLDFFRYGLLHFIIVITIFYSGVLVHRERESGIAEMVSASPAPDWILPLSKLLTLFALVTLFLVAMMLSTITLQMLDGYTQLELGLYLRAVFIYNGFYYWMLCVLAILVQVVVSRKWLGMLLVLALNAGLLSLEVLGLEHILYRFAIPPMIYSDMNGFGPASQQAATLIGYWGLFCGNLLLLGYLMYPRGVHPSVKEKMRQAMARLNTPVITAMVLLGIAWLAAGGWIFYNTNVLNSYQTTQDRQQLQADYERLYGQYENKATPSYRNIELAVDIFPEERRLESRGTAKLTNNKSTSINEFVITVKPGLLVHKIHIEAATLIRVDTAQGFYLFKPRQTLKPGETVTMHWHLSRCNQGFANANPDFEVVKNGTFFRSETVMPIPGFDDTRKLTDNAIRHKFNLKDVARLPALGNAQYLDQLMYGVDARTAFRIVVSTAADQVALASGKLVREWRQNGRRYFQYVSERPTWPSLYFTSARYSVARDQWRNGKQIIDLQVYYHPKHPYNVKAMLATTKRSLDYFTRAFGPYPYSQFKIMEYPRYRMAAQAFSGGGVAYSEALGWTSNLTTWKNLDYTTIHELSHQWWGDQAPGAKMQGREMLNETLAQYSTLMIFKKYDEEHSGSDLVNRIIRTLQQDYLRARSQDTGLEKPVMYTEDQDYVSYNKGALALYILQEQIGEEAVNRALRNFLSKFAFKTAPFATSQDLIRELRAVAGKEHQELITDLFEKIVLYEVKLLKASARKVNDGYEVSLTVEAHQLEATGSGTETEVPLHMWFDVGLFSQAKQAPENQVPLYLRKHLLQRGVNSITFKVAKKPVFASVDPYQKMADRWPENNRQIIKIK